MASRKGSDSMSPTVPPISTITTSAFDDVAPCVMRALISLVICGITCTVAPRKSPRRSRRMTASYTEPVVMLEVRVSASSVKRS